MGNDHSFGAKFRSKSPTYVAGDVLVEIPNEVIDRPKSRRVRSVASDVNHDSAIRKSMHDWQVAEQHLRDENNKLRIRLTQMTEEKKRMEEQRTRMLDTFQTLQTDLNDAKTAYKKAAEQLNFYRSEKDRIQRMFNQYRENKESELQALKRQQRAQLKATEEHCDKVSLMTETSSVPPSPSLCGSRMDVFGSCMSLNPFGSVGTVPSVSDGANDSADLDFLLNVSSSNAGGLSSYSSVSCSACITLCLLADSEATPSLQMDQFALTQAKDLEQLLQSRNRVFDLRTLNCDQCVSSHTLEQLKSQTQALLLVVFCGEQLSARLKQCVRTLYLENDRAALAVFSLSAEMQSDNGEFWDQIIRHGGTRFCRNSEGNEKCLKTASEEVELFLKTELQCETESDTSCDIYDTFWYCKTLLGGLEFCPFGTSAYQRDLLRFLCENCCDYWLDRPQLAEALQNYLHSTGPLAPLLVTGVKGVGVTTALAHWLRDMQDVMAGSVLCLYHFVTDAHSLTADPYLMLKRFCQILRLVVELPAEEKRQNWIDPENLKGTFMPLLEQAALKFSNGVLIVIDGLDKMMVAETTMDILSWLFSPLPVECRVVATACQDHNRTHWKSWSIFNLDVCLAPEVLHLLEGIFPTDKEFASILAAQLSPAALRTPEALVALGAFLAKLGREQRDKEVHEILACVRPPNASAERLYFELLQRAPALLPNFTYDQVQCVWKILGLLTCCREGLSRRELFGLVPALNQSLWDKIWPELRSFCGGIVMDVAGLYRLKNQHWRSAVSTLVEPSVLRTELYQFWSNHNFCWRRVDEQLWLSSQVYQSALKSDLFCGPVLLSLVGRGQTWQLLQWWRQCSASDAFLTHSLKSQLVIEFGHTFAVADPSKETASCYLALGVLSLDLVLAYELALKMLQRSSEMFQSQMGGDDPVVALASHYMAGCYAQNGNARIAEELHKKALSIYSATLGSTHAVVEAETKCLIQLFKSANKMRSAESQERKLIELRAKRERQRKPSKQMEILGQRRLKLVEAPDTVRTLNQLAMMRFCYADFDTAADLFGQALEMKSKLISGDNLDICRELQNVAAVAARRKDWETAEKCSLRILAIRERVLGSDDRTVMSAIRSVVQARQKQENTDGLETLLRRLIDFAQRNNEHAQHVTYLSQLAALFCRQGQHDKAQPVLEKALKISESCLVPCHPATIALRKVCAKLHLDVGNVDQAIRFYMQSQHRTQTLARPSVSVQPATPTAPTPQESVFVLAEPPPGRNRRSSLT